MSEEKTTMLGFGFQDDNDSNLQSKSGGVFGLNRNVHLVKFEYNPNAGRDNTAGDAIDISYQVQEKEFNTRIYPTTKVYDSNNNEITDTNSEEYRKAYNNDWIQKAAVITHILKAFRTEEEIKAALSGAINSFADYAKIVTALLPDNFKEKGLDLFLEYQWDIKDGNDRTFLQVPRNMKGGYFVCATDNKTYKRDETKENLVYITETGEEHPFTRNNAYMESNKANQQFEGQEAPSAGSAPAAQGQAKKSSW